MAATRLIPAMRELGHEVYGVMSSNADRAKSYAAKNGIPNFTVSLDEAVNWPVDAVYISTTNELHARQAIAAARAKKHVLCEKPVDLDINRANTIKDKVANSKTNVSIAFNRRYDPNFAAVYARVKAGELGNLEQLILTSRDPAPPPQSYIAVSGGIFRDQVIHDFDIARYFVGDIAEVSTFATNAFSSEIKAEGDFDTAITNLRSTDGKLVSIINSRHSSYGYDQRLEAFGDKGMLQITNFSPSTVKLFNKDTTAAGEPYLDFFLERYAASYRNELKVFIQGIQEGDNLGSTYDDGRAALILADAALESARTGKAVKVNF